MAEPSWDEIFGGQADRSRARSPGQEPAPTQPGAPEPVSEEFPAARLSDPFAVAAAQANAAHAQAARDAASTGTGQPLTRRELREAEARANGGGAEPPMPPPPHRRDRRPASLPVQRRPRRRWGWLVALIVVAVVGGGGSIAWFGFHDTVCTALTFCQESNDYTGSGDGKVTFVIRSGEIGSDVAKGLAKDGVTKTYEASYAILLKTGQSFEPGSYTLRKRMSAKAALAALADPRNRVVHTAILREGISAQSAFTQLAQATGQPVARFQAEAKDFTQFGIPANAPGIEGFMFPATYQFDPGTTAKQAIQTTVTTMFQHLDRLGVAPEDRLKVLTMASIVQWESGSVADMGKVARVFQNRLDRGMLLQSDATVAYGTGRTDRVTTTDAEREDASNPYNTYVHPGLPPGPIALPGDDALKAALNPTPGSWLYFVTVDLKTGQTVFSTTQAEHDAAVKQWQAWCKQSSANMASCS